MGINKNIYIIYYKLILQDKLILYFKITRTFFFLTSIMIGSKKLSINLVDALVTELIVLKVNKYTLQLLLDLI